MMDDFDHRGIPRSDRALMRRTKAQLAAYVQNLLYTVEQDGSSLRVAESKRTLAVADEANRWRPLLTWAMGIVEVAEEERDIQFEADDMANLAKAKTLLEEEPF